MSAPVQVVAQLVITLDSQGSVAISGPIQNKLLVAGMLECAKDGLFRMHMESSPIVALDPSLMGMDTEGKKPN